MPPRYDPDTENGFEEHEMRAVTFLDDRKLATALHGWVLQHAGLLLSAGCRLLACRRGMFESPFTGATSPSHPCTSPPARRAV